MWAAFQKQNGFVVQLLCVSISGLIVGWLVSDKLEKIWK
jgi:hypothetical protein